MKKGLGALAVLAALLAAVGASVPQQTTTYPRAQPGGMPSSTRYLGTQGFMEWVWPRTRDKENICKHERENYDYAVGRFYQWGLDNGYEPDANTIEDFIIEKCEVIKDV